MTATPLSAVPKRARLIVYGVALAVTVVLGAIGRGFAAIDHVQPDWLVFAASAWTYVAAAVTSALALGNLTLGSPEAR